ncbi:hypothetical protein, partial [Mesomycoplasma ovipneumoniae]|uniref:hypothetical protein n=1 Tax=Mesomycoplasma ovipneumoniae TaxID=29562 RepID=UPI002964CE6F
SSNFCFAHCGTRLKNTFSISVLRSFKDLAGFFIVVQGTPIAPCKTSLGLIFTMFVVPFASWVSEVSVEEVFAISIGALIKRFISLLSRLNDNFVGDSTFRSLILKSTTLWLSNGFNVSWTNWCCGFGIETGEDSINFVSANSILDASLVLVAASFFFLFISLSSFPLKYTYGPESFANPVFFNSGAITGCRGLKASSAGWIVTGTEDSHWLVGRPLASVCIGFLNS